MREMRIVYKILIRKPKGNRLLGRPSIDGMIILKWTLNDVRVWTGFI
jgi:hypothetical protein